jgi:TetR/AcrR family transcriptional regulator, transcriptional repressor for nem operon
LRDKAAAGLISWTKKLTETIELGIAAGEFKPETDGLGTALHVISLIEGASLFFRSTQDMKYVNRLMDATKTIIEAICI